MNEERKYLRALIIQVQTHLDEIDKIMKMPESGKRGELIAKTCNNLDFVKDRAKHFGLGISFKSKLWGNLK